MKLKICHLYYDVLNLYGDTGNIEAMLYRLSGRGIGVELHKVTIGDILEDDYDIVFIGGGQDTEQAILNNDFLTTKRDILKKMVEEGVVVLAICAGFQLLGNYYQMQDGRKISLGGIIDMNTVGGKKRMIGNLLVRTELPGVPDIIGFENHSGKTVLNGEVKPLGKVIIGHGNNGKDGYEGARYKNLLGTYQHGALLPKNPKLCDYLLECAIKRIDREYVLEELNDVLETEAHDIMVRRMIVSNRI